MLEKNRAAEGLDNIAGTPVCRPADGAAGRQVHGQRGRAGIAADWNTSFITVLGNVENDLAELNACSEAEMESLGGSFEILAAEAKTLLQHAHEIVACVQNERVDSVLADMQATCESSRSFLEERLEAATTILSTLEQLEQMLRQLTLATHSQEAIARHLLALSVLTNIEVAHLGAAGHNFQLLAQELSTFSKDLFAQTLESVHRHRKPQAGDCPGKAGALGQSAGVARRSRTHGARCSANPVDCRERSAAAVGHARGICRLY